MSSSYDGLEALRATPDQGGQPAGSQSDQMARLLELAARNADELVAEAEAEAEQVRQDARGEADRVLGEARAEAERVRAELETTRADLTAEIDRLCETEQQHRNRMREHLHDMLSRVDASEVG